MEKTLDVREMAPKERHPNIFETFASLEPGGAFVLINDHDPKPLLYQLQNEHDGEFDWWPLAQGPETWRITIARRTTADPDRTITGYFQSDHRRLDAIYGRFQDAAHEARWPDALSAFREFSLGLRRHIKAEEEILFPAFEEKTGMHDAGPTFVMKMEHKDIRELLDKITEHTEKGDGPVVSEAASALTNLLADHNMKEEHILYPESDSFLQETERTGVIKKAQTF
jgi:uncharacterized protein (DUF2249 family)/hemerythrin-like domain-containing protein